jgi:predicted RNA binding protein YcfA (HicA-like mRNA interferase family)
MRLPRDVSGRQLATLLEGRGVAVTRQKGSHMRLTTMENGPHHVTIPDHDALRLGTLSAILSDVAAHFGATRAELTDDLFGGSA